MIVDSQVLTTYRIATDVIVWLKTTSYYQNKDVSYIISERVFVISVTPDKNDIPRNPIEITS